MAGKRRRLLRTWATTLAFGLPGSAEIGADETVVFFDTAARPDASGRHWILPIHGWVYEPADSRMRKAVIAAALKARFGLESSAQTQANFDRRVNLFLADNERNRSVGIELAGRRFELPRSGANGHFETELRIDRKSLPADELRFEARSSDAAQRIFRGRAALLPSTGISVISDIDDTVKISEVQDPRALLDNTFFRDFRPTPGMVAKYAEWAEAGADFHFVSSSPWPLYGPLQDFLTEAGFPVATVSLKQVRIKDETLLDLFKAGDKTKPRQIEPILRQFPKRRFVLVGDSGERDPETYVALFRKYPEQISRIYIRNVTGAYSGDARFGPLFARVPADRWTLFTDPTALQLPESKPGS